MTVSRTVRFLRPCAGCGCWSASTPSTCSRTAPAGPRRAGIGRPRRRRGGHRQDRPAARLRRAGAATPVLWGMCDSLSTPRPLGPLRDVADELGPAGAARAARTRRPSTRSSPRCWTRCAAARACSWWRTCTGPTRRRWTSCASSPAASRALPLLMVLSYRDARRRRPPAEPGARRPRRHTRCAPPAAGPAEPGRRRRAARRPRPRPRRRAPPDRGQPVLRQPDPRPARVAAARERPRRGDRPDRRLAPPGAARSSCCRAPPNRVSGALLGRLGVSPTTVGALAATGLSTGADAGVAFRHEIARSAVLDATAPGAEPALHAAMIDALEAVGGDPSVLAHHAAAAGDVAPDPALRARRGGRGVPVGRAPGGRRVLRARAAPRGRRPRGPGRPARGAVRRAVPHRPAATTRSPPASRRWSCAASSGDIVAVGAGHTATRRLRLVRGRPRPRRSGTTRRPSRSSSAAATPRAGLRPGQPRLLRGPAAATPRRRGGPGTRAADRGRAGRRRVLHATASIGLAVARLFEGDVGARADLLAASDVGLRAPARRPRDRPDEQPLPPRRRAGALRRRREVPRRRAAHQRGARRPDLHHVAARGAGAAAAAAGTLPEAEQDARAVLVVRGLPLSQLWPHLVLGLLAARREAPPDKRASRRAVAAGDRFDIPGKIAPAAAALAEQAWIIRRPDPRLNDPLVTAAGHAGVRGPGRPAHPSCGGRAASPTPVSAPRPAVPGLRAGRRGSPTSGPWPGGTPGRPTTCWPRSRCSTGWTPAPSPRCSGPGCASPGVSSVPRGRRRPRGPTRPGSPTRQLDVLALLVDGLSNADIAARLVISRKTADHHVSAILAKLEVRSRTQAAAVARRLGVPVAVSPTSSR